MASSCLVTFRPSVVSAPAFLCGLSSVPYHNHKQHVTAARARLISASKLSRPQQAGKLMRTAKCRFSHASPRLSNGLCA